MERMEKASRTDLVEALKDAGFPAAEAKPSGETPVPDAVESALAELSVLRQLEATRRLHALIREKGESPALLGALARAYANLGQITYHYWDATPEAYRARSLLFARRLVVAQPKSPLALWNRAYAYALGGLHQYALEDIAEAKKLAQAAPGTPVPPWLDTIESYLHYNTDRLLDLSQHRKDQSQLAGLLAFLTVNYRGTDLYSIGVGQQVLAANPRGLRVLDGMTRFQGVGLGHRVTEFGLGAVPRAAIQGVGEMEMVPASVKEATPKNPAELDMGTVVRIAEAFEAAAPDDLGEPSWTAFGHALREQQFIVIYRRAVFMRNVWGGWTPRSSWRRRSPR